ncbi:FAD binding domain-containing protein [Streptomyces radicis]|uniref:Xanthine dehydrogenase family protein subunit M n=1 Tax=Streptomyces radicis TaxID=1750517 RepID=A0A3A9VWI7_9ACTN|nr:xanthine dehydrogenase family protein subunit M [Streptomyces radicis]RKN05375.1 xanthine dehydrogenase family protein subunit M [Streptomyces radicis]RKN16883.1 xanthine dehydrogenase family protein subunit M [Streptomyces radicis]
MRPFVYERATGPEHAAALLTSDPGATLLAGGTNLVDLMKLGVARPSLVVDINGLPYDRVDHRDDGSLVVGATVRNSDLAGDPGVRRRFPLLSEALLAGASGQLRARATTAGNLLQRTRCVYFQDIGKPCNKRAPGTGCAAVEGSHRDLAVLGTSDACVASHPSDLAVALAALDATVLVRPIGDGQGPSRIPLTDLYRLPGDTPDRETVLRRGDLVTGVEVPPPPVGAAMRYRKVRDRWSFAFAVVSVAVLVTLDEDGALRDVRLALGGVAPLPWRAREAERLLTGRRPTRDLVRSAADAEFAAARPLPHNAFKVGLAADVLTETVLALAAPAGSER